MSYQEITVSGATFRFLYRIEGEKGWRRDLPPEFEAVFVEVMHAQPIADLDERVSAYLRFFETSSDLAFLRERAKADRVTIYFGDLAENPLFSVGHDTGVLLAQGLLGLGLWLKSGRILLGRKRVRRFGWRLLTMILGGIWLVAGLFELIGFGLVRFPGKVARKGLRRTWLEGAAYLSNLHPEKPLVFLRNLVLAEKVLEAARLEQNKEGKKARIVLDFHYGHAGILRMLRWRPELRRLALQAYQPFLRKLMADPVQADYFARLTSVCWSKEGWKRERSFKVDSLEPEANPPFAEAASG